jgi:hypothetical protein
MLESGSLKSIFLLVAILVVTASNAFAQASYETIDSIRYLIDSDAKTATVMPLSDDQKYSGDIVVPEKVKASDGAEYPVTALGENAFKECTKLASVTIPSSVTSLGDYCFSNCSGLTGITIPSSVTSLGNWCFAKCKKLTNITLPDNITKFGELCFAESGLTRITIPSSIKQISNYCFYRCRNLTSVNIPSSVTSFAGQCFKDCNNLPSITISSSVTSLGQDCLGGCSSLKSATFKGKMPWYTIDCGLYASCVLHVPQAYLQDYKDALSCIYSSIYAIEDGNDDGDRPYGQCSAPTITYADGELHFNSPTPNAKYYYTITDSDVTSYAYSQDGVVTLSASYQISAYATAAGYTNSDKATAVLYWLKLVATLEDGTSTNINQAKTRAIVATSRDGIVTLSGLDNGEEVRFYSVDDKQIGTTKAIDGVASQAVSSASLVIAKIADQAIKIAVK